MSGLLNEAIRSQQKQARKDNDRFLKEKACKKVKEEYDQDTVDLTMDVGDAEPVDVADLDEASSTGQTQGQEFAKLIISQLSGEFIEDLQEVLLDAFPTIFMDSEEPDVLMDKFLVALERNLVDFISDFDTSIFDR